ncbi:hypothetical protein PHLCEN_2v8087 [Hermanssonia centrifuga]|uniref:Uncharacterized protein n=1 Tax=Hermanssonia centrifuga TaxID=98765 RepID=A0A2R6NUR7_9APHY|nr:hypothetical protein PHLCEN_2v8087 [Hermanssonia centrifuga]
MPHHGSKLRILKTNCVNFVRLTSPNVLRNPPTFIAASMKTSKYHLPNAPLSRLSPLTGLVLAKP